MGKINWVLGEVFWFSDEKGIGLVKSDDGEKHIIHYSQIKNLKGWKTLKKGQAVQIKFSNKSEVQEVNV